VLRCFKTVNDSYIEPISFIVPRRSEMFQSDIYPPTTGLKAGTSAAEWFGGQTALPPKISLESVYDGNAPEEVATDFKPSTSTALQSPPPTKTVSEPPKPTPAPAPVPVASPVIAQRGPPPAMKDNKASIATMADKFADNEEDSSDDETSSFEEVPKPVERPAAARVEEKARAPQVHQEPEPPKSIPSVSAPAKAPAPAGQATPSTSTTQAPPPTAAAATAGIKDYLSDLKTMLEAQNKALADQSQQIAALTKEVSLLKTKVGDQGNDRAKDERIRELELELEEARS